VNFIAWVEVFLHSYDMDRLPPDQFNPPSTPATRYVNRNIDAEPHPLAIISLVCGIVGFVTGLFLWLFGIGFLAIIFPILGVVFGHISLVSCKKNPQYYAGGMAITGLILSYIQLVLGMVVLLVIIGFLAFLLKESLDHSSGEMPEVLTTLAVDAPEYSTLIGEELSGSGFHFKYEDETYIACSLHQFGNKTPEVMSHLDFEEPIKIKELVATQDDVQILAFSSEQLSEVTGLNYDPTEEVGVNDRVYLYDFEDVYTGHISLELSAGFKYQITLHDPYPAAGNSGSPVVSATTGNVIGVVLSADDGERASIVDFERLTWTK